WPQRLSHLTHRYAKRAGDAAVELHLQLGLLTLRGETDVHRSWHLLHLGAYQLGRLVQRPELVPADLKLDLLEATREVAREHCDGRSGDTVHLVPDLARELLDRTRALGLGHGADVDVAHVNSTVGATTKRGVGVSHFLMCAGDARGFLRLESRVLEVRAGRRLDLHDELGAVVLGE